MTEARDDRLRLQRDRSLWIAPASGVVAGGSPWRLSRVADVGRPLLSRLASQDEVEVTSRQDAAVAQVFVERGWAHPVPRPRPGPHPVTVVVPAYGRTEPLRRCLSSLQGLEVVVVDDASPDAQEMRDVAVANGARCVRLPDNRGPAAARNRGLAEAASELVAFVDSDCVPDPGWLDALVPHFDDPRVVLVAPRIQPRAEDSGSLAAFEQASSALDMGRHPALVRPGARLGFLPSATVLVRRQAMIDNAFDESLRLGEDVDLVWRLADAGGLVRFEPRAIVRHDPPATWASWARRRAEYGTSAVPLEAKHPGRLTPVRVSPWNLAVFLAFAAGQPVAATGVAAIAGGLLARRLARSGMGVDIAMSLVAKGLSADAVAAGQALRREYWPVGALAVAASPLSRTARLATAAMTVPLALEWVRERPSLDPVRYIALRAAADASYGTGVLASCWRARTLAPLTPRLRRREAQPPTT